MTFAFYAYPSAPPAIAWAISSALDARARTDALPVITPWPKIPNIGLRLDDQIRDQIAGSACLIADITVPNFNVFYEIGYAVGRGKPIVPTVNNGLQDAKRMVVELGLFDNLGYLDYANSDELLHRLSEINQRPLLSEYAKDLDHQQPLFFLDSLVKTDFRNKIVSAIKAAKVFYRSYDPVEAPRLSATDAIGFVTASSGVVVPLLSAQVLDSDRHNMRAAFIAGLAHGLERKALLIQLNEEPAPADYREYIVNVRDPQSVSEKVTSFAREALSFAQEIKQVRKRRTQATPAIARLSLGASAAENEFRHLEDYFIQTFQFRRALEGQGKIVVGRKGSGKTAIFFQVRDRKRQDRRNVVVDLKPESHQLSLLRENLIDLYDIGVFDHTVAAFWQYLILVEILLKLREIFLLFPNRSADTMARIVDIERILDTSKTDLSGDFTSRLTALVQSIVQELDAAASKGQRPSVEDLTNIGLHPVPKTPS